MRQFRIVFKTGLPTNWLNMKDFSISQVSDLVKSVTKYEKEYDVEYKETNDEEL